MVKVIKGYELDHSGFVLGNTGFLGCSSFSGSSNVPLVVTVISTGRNDDNMTPLASISTFGKYQNL